MECGWYFVMYVFIDLIFHVQSLQQDVLAHQSIVDSVEDKAKAVTSTTSMSKVTQLKSRYKTVASLAAVRNHQ